PEAPEQPGHLPDRVRDEEPRGLEGHFGEHAARRHLRGVQAEHRQGLSSTQNRQRIPADPAMATVAQALATTRRASPPSARLFTAALALPAAAWYIVLLVTPLIIVTIFSFGVRARNGGYAPAFVLDNYARAVQKSEPFVLSLEMAVAGTIGCL